MKKIVSIILLFVFLFNIIGYKFFFDYLQYSADVRIESKIQTLHEFDEYLITIKIPINLPYQTDWKDFEPASGEMVYKGITYKYVKQKVQKDTLILLCINHTERSSIDKNSCDYFKKVNDLASETNKKPTIKQPKTDYYQETKNNNLAFQSADPTKYHNYTGVGSVSGHPIIIENPPEIYV